MTAERITPVDERCGCGNPAAFRHIYQLRYTQYKYYHCETCQAAWVLGKLTGNMTGYYAASERRFSNPPELEAE